MHLSSSMAGILNSGYGVEAGQVGFDTCTVTNMVAEQGSSMDSSGSAGGGLFCIKDPDTDNMYVPDVSQEALVEPMMMGSVGLDEQYFIGDHTVDTGSGGELAGDCVPDNSYLYVDIVVNKFVEDSKNMFWTSKSKFRTCLPNWMVCARLG